VNALLHDSDLQAMLAGIVGALIVFTVIGQVLRRMYTGEGAKATLRNMNARIRGWWVMIVIFTVFLLGGTVGIIVMFALLSFLALREFMTLGSTHRADHKALIWVFFVFTPLQYVLVARGYVELFTILIPVLAFIVISSRTATMGDTDQFLERTAIIQWALLACTYCISFVPALMQLDIDGYEHPAKLVIWFVLVVQISDVFQYIWGKLLGKRQISPVSPNKTWEGLIGGIACATGVGAAMWWVTPFSPLEAAGLSLVVCVLGFFGGLVMSAIKRDRGVKDYGAIIAGHGGVLDRIDSLIFSAPVFFWLARFAFE
jgi:phosphatidate cytidylyltransferase